MQKWNQRLFKNVLVFFLFCTTSQTAFSKSDGKTSNPPEIFETVLDLKESKWIEAYQKWKASLLSFQDQALKTCLSENLNAKAAEKGPIAMQLVVDRAQCQVQKAFVDAGLDQRSSGKLCPPIDKSAQSFAKRSIASHRQCLQHYSSLITQDVERLLAKIKDFTLTGNQP